MSMTEAMDPEGRLIKRLSDMLSIAASTRRDMEELAAQGFPPHTVAALVANGFPQKEIDWILSRHSQNKQEQLTPEESARLVQLAAVYCLAEAALGGPQAAWEWLQSPRPAYGGLSLIELSKSKYGAVHVKELLAKRNYSKCTETTDCEC